MKSSIKKHKFYFQGKEIEIVEQYTYLGFTFIPSGKKHIGIENLLKKSSKAWFAIDYYLNRKKDTYLHLIETIVKRIALYACESWGDCDKKKQN